MQHLRGDARLIARNPGAWIALTGLLSLAMWPMGFTLRVLFWMDLWGRGPGLVLRVAWTALGIAWVRRNQGGSGSAVVGGSTPSAPQLAIDAASVQLVPQLATSHDAANAVLRAKIEARCGGGSFRTPDQGEPYTLVKTGLLSASGALVPRGDPRARNATAYLHRATAGPRFLVARVDIASGEYSEQPVDERHWNLIVG